MYLRYCQKISKWSKISKFRHYLIELRRLLSSKYAFTLKPQMLTDRSLNRTDQGNKYLRKIAIDGLLVRSFIQLRNILTPLIFVRSQPFQCVAALLITGPVSSHTIYHNKTKTFHTIGPTRICTQSRRGIHLYFQQFRDFRTCTRVYRCTWANWKKKLEVCNNHLAPNHSNQAYSQIKEGRSMCTWTSEQGLFDCKRTERLLRRASRYLNGCTANHNALHIVANAVAALLRRHVKESRGNKRPIPCM